MKQHETKNDLQKMILLALILLVIIGAMPAVSALGLPSGEDVEALRIAAGNERARTIPLLLYDNYFATKPLKRLLAGGFSYDLTLPNGLFFGQGILLTAKIVPNNFSSLEILKLSASSSANDPTFSELTLTYLFPAVSVDGMISFTEETRIFSPLLSKNYVKITINEQGNISVEYDPTAPENPNMFFEISYTTLQKSIKDALPKGVSLPQSAGQKKVCASFFWGINCSACHKFINPDTQQFKEFFSNLKTAYPFLEIRAAEVESGNWAGFNAKVEPLLNLLNVPAQCPTSTSCESNTDCGMANYYCSSGKICTQKSTIDKPCGRAIPTLIIGNKVMIGSPLINEHFESIVKGLRVLGSECKCFADTDCVSGETCQNNKCIKSCGESACEPSGTTGISPITGTILSIKFSKKAQELYADYIEQEVRKKVGDVLVREVVFPPNTVTLKCDPATDTGGSATGGKCDEKIERAESALKAEVPNLNCPAETIDLTNVADSVAVDVFLSKKCTSKTAVPNPCAGKGEGDVCTIVKSAEEVPAENDGVCTAEGNCVKKTQPPAPCQPNKFAGIPAIQINHSSNVSSTHEFKKIILNFEDKLIYTPQFSVPLCGEEYVFLKSNEFFNMFYNSSGSSSTKLFNLTLSLDPIKERKIFINFPNDDIIKPSVRGKGFFVFLNNLNCSGNWGNFGHALANSMFDTCFSKIAVSDSAGTLSLNPLQYSSTDTGSELQLLLQLNRSGEIFVLGIDLAKIYEYILNPSEGVAGVPPVVAGTASDIIIEVESDDAGFKMDITPKSFGLDSLPAIDGWITAKIAEIFLTKNEYFIVTATKTSTSEQKEIVYVQFPAKIESGKTFDFRDEDYTGKLVFGNYESGINRENKYNLPWKFSFYQDETFTGGAIFSEIKLNVAWVKSLFEAKPATQPIVLPEVLVGTPCADDAACGDGKRCVSGKCALKGDPAAQAAAAAALAARAALLAAGFADFKLLGDTVAFKCAGNADAVTGSNAFIEYGFDVIKYTWNKDNVSEEIPLFCNNFFCDATQFTLSMLDVRQQTDKAVKEIFKTNSPLLCGNSPNRIPCTIDQGAPKELHLTDLYPLFKKTNIFGSGETIFLDAYNEPLKLQVKKDCLKGSALQNEVLEKLSKAIIGTKYDGFENIFAEFEKGITQCYGAGVDSRNVFLKIPFDKTKMLDDETFIGKILIPIVDACSKCSPTDGFISFSEYKSLHEQLFKQIDWSTLKCKEPSTTGNPQCIYTYTRASGTEIPFTGTAEEWIDLLKFLYENGKFELLYIVRPDASDITKGYIINYADDFELVKSNTERYYVDLRMKSFLLIGDNFSEDFKVDFLTKYAADFETASSSAGTSYASTDLDFDALVKELKTQNITVLPDLLANYEVMNKKYDIEKSLFVGEGVSEERKWKLGNSGEYITRYDPVLNVKGVTDVEIKTAEVQIGQINNLKEVDVKTNASYSKNVFLYLPFNGTVGEKGERQGYGLFVNGAVESGEPFFVKHAFEESIIDAALYPVKGEDSIELNTKLNSKYFDVRDGKIVGVSFNSSNLSGEFSYAPSIPIALALESEANNNVFYMLTDAGEKHLPMAEFIETSHYRGLPFEQKYLFDWHYADSEVRDLFTVEDEFWEFFKKYFGKDVDLSNCEDKLEGPYGLDNLFGGLYKANADNLFAVTYVPFSVSNLTHKLQLLCADKPVQFSALGLKNDGTPVIKQTINSITPSGAALELVSEELLAEKPTKTLTNYFSGINDGSVCFSVVGNNKGKVSTNLYWNSQNVVKEMLKAQPSEAATAEIGLSCASDAECKGKDMKKPHLLSCVEEEGVKNCKYTKGELDDVCVTDNDCHPQPLSLGKEVCIQKFGEGNMVCWMEGAKGYPCSSNADCKGSTTCIDSYCNFKQESSAAGAAEVKFYSDDYIDLWSPNSKKSCNALTVFLGNYVFCSIESYLGGTNIAANGIRAVVDKMFAFQAVSQKKDKTFLNVVLKYNDEKSGKESLIADYCKFLKANVSTSVNGTKKFDNVNFEYFSFINPVCVATILNAIGDKELKIYLQVNNTQSEYRLTAVFEKDAHQVIADWLNK